MNAYSYYKKCSVVATIAGAQADYQMTLLVGESAGAAGEDVDCGGHCQDFPNDIRFTAADGQTKHDYWVESITGTMPNRLATIRIEVASIPASGSIELYMYYGATSDSGDSDGDNTFINFMDFEEVEWVPYSANPVLSPIGDEDHTGFASVWKDGVIYHMFYFYNDSANKRVIGHATSNDGKAWTRDSVNNPILEKSASGWDNGGVAVSMVWKETSTWYMLYRGEDTLGVYHIGLATASDPEGPWTKSGSNPIINTAEDEDPWGIIKVASTYYLWTNNTGGTRFLNLWTSTNLTTWTPDANNHIFTDGRFCSFVFKRGSYFYMLVTHYTSGTDYSEFELYRDTNPTFYSADRELIRIVKTCPGSGWDSHDEDTSCVLTETINRDTFVDDKLWTYYSGESGGIWKMGLLEEDDIDNALNKDDFIKWTTDAYCTFKSQSGGYHSDYMGEFDQISGSNAGHSYASLTEITDDARAIEFVIKPESAVGSTYYYVGLMNGAGYVIYLAFKNTGNIEYYDGSWHVLQAYSQDTWYNLVIYNLDFTNNQFDVDINGTNKGVNCGFYSANSAINKIDLGGSTLYIDTLIANDNILQRKYASPEPTWGTWGAEQSQEALERGYYYAKLGSTYLYGLEHPSFRITEELNKIPSFEFEIANCTENRTAITAGITDTIKIYRLLDGTNTLMFTGIINGDAIEYLSLERIRIIGYASYIDLNWRFHQHLDSSDAEAVSTVFDSGAGYTNYTTQANNDTINDVLLTFSTINHALYIGMNETFFGAQIKYSTKGVQAANTTVVVEYSQTGVSWATMDVLDESRAFTEDTGTCYLTIPHKPSDWAKQTVNSVKRFWIRVRISAGSYTTPPKLDRIKMMNVDAYRVYYFNTAANTIMDDVLAGTGYSMDVTDACPADVISIVGEYETKLRLIAGIANALTWDDSGDKKAYQWWIDTSKKVHFKQERGAVHGDITGDLTILNNSQDYFNLSNRLHFMGNYDGLNQIRAVIEDTGSQDTHEIRELAVPAEQYNNYTPLKEAAQKAMTYTKAPLQKIAATVTTKYWIDNSFEVGDTVTLHATSWDVASQAFQIVRADIGPRVTNLDIGVSQEHLDSLKAGLQRQLDINNIRMHGSTSLLQFGPETANYHRVDNTTVYPARLNIEIPSATRYIQKVFLSWTIGPYRSSVDGGGETSGHDHTGSAGAGGAFTPDVSADGKHTPVAVAKAHKHASTAGGVSFAYSTRDGWLATSKAVVSEKAHTHTNQTTGLASQDHTHTLPTYTGAYDNDNEAVVDAIYSGTACASGWCITGSTTVDVPSTTHFHSLGGSTGDTSHSHAHTQGVTGAGSSHTHNITTTQTTTRPYMIHPLTIDLSLWVSDEESPAHNHTVTEVPNHDHPGVAEGAHSDHSIIAAGAADIALTFGIHEEAAGTLLELIINGETVSSSYSGNQLEIRIDGYLSTGNNTVLIQPATGENGKKGSCTTLGGGTIFIEAGKF